MKTEKPFPKIVEHQMKFYDKQVPKQEILNHLMEKLKDFPDIEIGYQPIPTMKPIFQQEESALIVRHKSNVLKTIIFMYRIVEFGNNIMIAVYKMSDYVPPEKTYTKNAEKRCLGEDRIYYTSNFNGAWVSNLTHKDIFNGALVSIRYEDGKDLRLGEIEEEKIFDKPGCMVTHQELRTVKVATDTPPYNETITRNELFHAFMFHCELAVWNDIQKYIDEY